MNRALLFLSTTLLCLPLAAQEQPTRPKITGIVSIKLRTRDLSRSQPFYAKLFSQDHPCVWCGELPKITFSVNTIQYIELNELSANPASNEVEEITFATEDVGALWRYMGSRHVNLASPIHKFANGQESAQFLELEKVSSNNPAPNMAPDERFSLLDPNGQEIAFVQLPSKIRGRSQDKDKTRLVQVGIGVKNIAAENQFYIDVLGFRPAPSEETRDSDAEAPVLQVPDGTDQLKYTLTLPAGSDKYALGAMNEIVVSVSDIEQSSFEYGKKGISVPDTPQVVGNGVWQVNFLDPEGMRIRLMEFTPALNRYTSQFTAPTVNP